jgi:enoyl-CoA hydratase
MSPQLVTVQVADHIGTITMDHPPMNLLGAPLLKALDQTFAEMDGNETVRAVVLTAAGRYFCPGADIHELTQLETAYQGAELSAQGQALLNRIERSETPVIAAINGACFGGGLELAMACHMRIAAAGVQFGLPEVKLGLIPGFGGTQRLPRIIGPSKAAEMILTGESLTAEEALTLGLVNRVVAGGEVLKQAHVLAGIIAARGRLAIQSALRAIRTSLDSPLAEGLAREAQLFGRLCETADKKEGTEAFLSKRSPRFTDH